jgi:hypothetical protein
MRKSSCHCSDKAKFFPNSSPSNRSFLCVSAAAAIHFQLAVALIYDEVFINFCHVRRWLYVVSITCSETI